VLDQVNSIISPVLTVNFMSDVDDNCHCKRQTAYNNGSITKGELLAYDSGGLLKAKDTLTFPAAALKKKKPELPYATDNNYCNTADTSGAMWVFNLMSTLEQHNEPGKWRVPGKSAHVFKARRLINENRDITLMAGKDMTPHDMVSILKDWLMHLKTPMLGDVRMMAWWMVSGRVVGYVHYLCSVCVWWWWGGHY
jgi:hypothetical protein